MTITQKAEIAMKDILTEEFLYTEYIKKGKTIRQIRENIGCSIGTIVNHMKKKWYR